MPVECRYRMISKYIWYIMKNDMMPWPLVSNAECFSFRKFGLSNPDFHPLRSLPSTLVNEEQIPTHSQLHGHKTVWYF